MKYKIKGKEIDGEKLELNNFDIHTSERKSIIRHLFTLLFIVVVGCIIFSLIYENDEVLINLLSFLLMPIGVVIGFYFGKKNLKNE